MVADELSQNKARSTLALARYSAQAAEEAGLHRDKLGIAGKVKDVAGVHKTLWPQENQREEILQIGFIIGEVHPELLEEGETGEDRIELPES